MEQSQHGHMEQERLYDLIFIARPATPEEDIKKVISGIEHTCAEKGGKIEKTENWGTRRLAYKVAKHREGIYIYHQIRTGHGELMAELERRLRVQDVVIKYLTIRLDEDLKLQKKLGERREKRAARRPRRTPSAPSGGGTGGASSERHVERSQERSQERERHVENAG
jgi:small subunit ribosomal protein S6